MAFSTLLDEVAGRIVATGRPDQMLAAGFFFGSRSNNTCRCKAAERARVPTASAPVSNQAKTTRTLPGTWTPHANTANRLETGRSGFLPIHSWREQSKLRGLCNKMKTSSTVLRPCSQSRRTEPQRSYPRNQQRDVVGNLPPTALEVTAAGAPLPAKPPVQKSFLSNDN